MTVVSVRAIQLGLCPEARIVQVISMNIKCKVDRKNRGSSMYSQNLDRVQWSEFDSVWDDVWICDDIWA